MKIIKEKYKTFVTAKISKKSKPVKEGDLMVAYKNGKVRSLGNWTKYYKELSNFGCTLNPLGIMTKNNRIQKYGRV